MPATLDKSIILSACPYIIYEEEFSAINAGEAFDLSWTAAEGPALLASIVTGKHTHKR